MNIDDYRAMVAEEAKAEESKKDQTDVKDEEAVKEPEVKEEDTKPKDDETNTKPKDDETPTPEKINIEGIGEVTLDDIKEWHKGNLRQSDYTKKTQELSNQKKENEKAVQLYNYLQANPKVAQSMLQTEGANKDELNVVDPNDAKYTKLEQKVYDLMLQLEVKELSSKYDDFDAKEVLDVAYSKNINNLEDAYLLVKSQKPAPKQESVDVEKLKKELREEMKKELEANQDTSTIISSNDGKPPSQDDEPKLSDAEKKVARMQGLSEKDYVKWRDTNTKR